jgi:hypothetical protein
MNLAMEMHDSGVLAISREEDASEPGWQNEGEFKREDIWDGMETGRPLSPEAAYCKAKRSSRRMAERIFSMT